MRKTFEPNGEFVLDQGQRLVPHPGQISPRENFLRIRNQKLWAEKEARDARLAGEQNPPSQ